MAGCTERSTSGPRSDAGRRRARLALAGLATLGAVASGCTPPPAPATRLDITTLQTWCGGVIPPPGEPWCHTNAHSETVEIRQGRTVIDTVTTDGTGRAKVVVAPGKYVVAKVSPAVYEQCDEVAVIAVEGATTPVTQECTIMAP